MTRPLLVVDGDSFAHRSYHALPKTIRRPGGKGAGAILGFANFLLKLYEAEKPQAVLVGWDSLDEPTYRHEALASYQGGREFDDELVEQRCHNTRRHLQYLKRSASPDLPQDTSPVSQRGYEDMASSDRCGLTGTLVANICGRQLAT